MDVLHQIGEFFHGLFAWDQWPARWHCGRWTGFHGWLYIISDLLIWGAYFAIPIIIISFISRKKELKFLTVYYLFAAFILACGTTHLLDAVTFWYPVYRFSALVRFGTAIISWATVFFLIKLLPVAFALKSPEHLLAEVERRKKVEEQLQLSVARLNEAQDICRMGHWEWDIATDGLSWSEGMLKVFGMPAGQPDLSLSSIMAMVHADDRGNVEAMLGELKAGRDYAEFYERIVTPDGTGKTLLIRSKAIKDSSGRTVQVLGTAQDITGEKKTEQELTSKTRELQAANDELEKFAYIASHDLQEPLRKITMFGEILTEEYGDILDEKGKTHLHKITDASVRMKALILDILNFSRIAYSDVMYEECDLNQVIGQVLSDMEVAIGTNQAVVAYGQIPAIQAHSVQMGQLFQNLISNSIKFKKPGLPPVIDITAAIIRGGELPRPEAIKANYKLGGWNDDRYWQGEPFVRITVSDNGIGFDPEYAEKIFLLFQRLNTDQVAPGTGIGLTICKKIVDIHHGAISAEPGERQGATFTIILPVSQANF